MASLVKQYHASRLCDLSEEHGKTISSIQGYAQMPLVPLEKAVESLVLIVRDVQRMVWTVKQNCETPSDQLTPDESASIMLYSLEWHPRETSFYYILNTTLRSGNRFILKPWFLYLKLMLTALSKLPTQHRFLHRGIKKDLSAEYPQGRIFVWWGFSSCTSSVHVLENEAFLGRTGARTLFTIECHSGKDIRHHSMFQTEHEILLMAARQFKVLSHMNAGNGLNIIQIAEIEPLYPLLEPLSSAQISSTDREMELTIKQTFMSKQSKRLDLMNMDITQHSLQLLVDGLCHNRSLEELNIAYNSLSDSGVRALASIMNTSVLKWIDLSENEISDRGAEDLAEMLPMNTHLLRLSLSGNRIGNAGVTVLANALASCHTCLELLDLSANTDINDGSVSSLIGMMERNKTLKKLDLRHNRLSKDGQRKLREAAKSKEEFEIWLSSFV